MLLKTMLDDAPPEPPPEPRDFPERRLEIPARLDRLGEARRFADAAAEEYGFSAPERYTIRLAVTEAVSNAVQHGSSSEEDPIEVRAADEAGALAFYVVDRGRFVPKMAVDDELPEQGRGLLFMAQLMDDVEVRPGPDGTVIRFSKQPSS
jgi:anti-sigma regulatory factor (Ser/Thr protein kinase)